MLLSWWLTKRLDSYFFILSTRLDTDTFPPPLCGLFLCSTAWPRSLSQFLLCTVEKGNWCFYHDGCSKVHFFLLFSVKQIAHWLLPFASVCALLVLHSLATTPAAVSALSRWERQLMLLSWWLTKRLALSLFLPLFKKGASHWHLPFASVWLSMCSTAWPRSLPQFLLCPVEKGSWCFYHDGSSKVGILSFLFCQLDWTLTPSLRLCLCSPCVPQPDHDPYCYFCFVPLRKAADASM